MRLNKTALMKVTISLKATLLLLTINLYSFADTAHLIDINNFGKILVLDEGRIKPLYTYAKKKLIQISGRSKIGEMSSLEWLMKLMINPESIDTVECFRIINPETVDALGIQGPYKQRYRYTELYEVLRKCEQFASSTSMKKPAEIMPYEREIFQLWNNIREYTAISSMYSAFEPFGALNVKDSALAASLHIQVNHPYSFGDLIGKSSILSTHMKMINHQTLNSLTNAESELIQLVQTLHSMGSQMQNSPPFLIPVMDNNNENWYSIWGYLNKSGNSAFKDKRVQLLINLKKAYMRKDIIAFDNSVNELIASSHKHSPGSYLEIFYNNVNPFFWGKILFSLAGIICLLTIFCNTKWTVRAGLILIGTGFTFQTAGLLLRVLIQMRPPLASLYETFVVVSWIIVLLGFILELLQKRNTGALIASFGGFLFLVISDRYTMNGDTFSVIPAVLNSGFWLTTHIVTISIGYAGFLISGFLGHVHLIQCAFKMNEKITHSTFSIVYLFLLMGLAFTVTGTLLGGMWADQAWGRFWGWDPKENGALLIILWGAAVIYARKGNLIGPKLTSVFSIIGIIMVMLAWIGVNLLGIGLHSYGFTYSGMGILASIIGFELFFILMFAIMIYRKCVPAKTS